MYRFLRVLPFAVLLSIWSFSQEPAQEKESPAPQLQPRPSAPAQPTPQGTQRRITIEVQVNDKAGAPVRGLQKEDFTLLDDKQPLPIVSFQTVDRSTPAAADPPVQIILVVDAVNAGFQAVTFQRNELRKFLLQNGGKLAEPVSLLIFTDTDSKMQPEPSRDGNALAALYDQYQTGLRIINRSQGFYGAADRYGLSLRALSGLANFESGRPGRKLVLWISPGWPLLSGPRIQLTVKQEDQIFRNIVDTSAQLRQADVTLYAIDPLGLADFGTRTTYYEEFLKGVPYARKALPGNMALQVLATQTGGRVIHTTNDLTNAMSTCASDAEAYYILSFDAPRADHADEFHSLAVTVDKPGAVARTRTGYYNQP